MTFPWDIRFGEVVSKSKEETHRSNVLMSKSSLKKLYAGWCMSIILFSKGKETNIETKSTGEQERILIL